MLYNGYHYQQAKSHLYGLSIRTLKLAANTPEDGRVDDDISLRRIEKELPDSQPQTFRSPSG